MTLLDWATDFLVSMQDFSFTTKSEISLDNFLLAKLDPYGFIDNDRQKHSFFMFDHKKEDWTTGIAFDYDFAELKIIKTIQLAIRPKQDNLYTRFSSLGHDSVTQIETVENRVVILQEWSSLGVLNKLVIEGDSIFGRYEYLSDIDCLVLKETTNSVTLPKSIGSHEETIMGVKIFRSVNPREVALDILKSANLDRIITALAKKGFIQVSGI